MKAGGRIGRVKAWWTGDVATPQFRLVVEAGVVTLSCWRCVGEEDWSLRLRDSAPPRYIFERVS